MADLFRADGLDEEQVDYIENEFFAGFKRYNNHETLPEQLNTYNNLADELKNLVSANLCRDLLREEKITKVLL
ncbi:hypothetical protein ACLKMH_13005 [Psychromonas sp. KJ10-10]|uniref:hypothetical protein n=1 Tax=Psychromonas sp. KJ10-10 TaxID=3391823 RepID=UPI0039B5B75C